MVFPEPVPPAPDLRQLVRELTTHIVQAKAELNRAKGMDIRKSAPEDVAAAFAKITELIDAIRDDTAELFKIACADRLAEELDIRMAMLILEAQRFMNRAGSMPQSGGS